MGDAKVVVKDKDGKPVGDPIGVTITKPKGETWAPAPSITTGSEKDQVPADGSEKTLDDKVKDPTDGMTGEVQDKDGKPVGGPIGVTITKPKGETETPAPSITTGSEKDQVPADGSEKTLDDKVKDP